MTFMCQAGERTWMKRSGTTRDISGRGVFVFAPDPPPCGTPLIVLLPARNPSGPVWMAGKGKVVRMEQPPSGRSGFAVGGLRFVRRRGKQIEMARLLKIL